MAERIAGYQSWRDLLFLHWRVNADKLQNLLPDGLTIDTWDGSAWLAVVPFAMERVRPWWSPPIPGISWFLETNVRTYVRHAHGQTGVWFFSLDANHRLAVHIARRFWHLNYQFSELRLKTTGGQLEYAGSRPDSPETAYEIRAETHRSEAPATAIKGSLEHFLLERYHLLARRPDGKFLCGQVHHEPYSYLPVSVATISQTFTAAAGYPISAESAPDHIVYSPGVDVRVSPLQPADLPAHP